MTISANDQADAKHRELVVVIWRDWRAYLQANLDLLAAHQQINAESDFEQRSATGSRETRARSIIAAIPPDKRRLFAAVCARRRAVVLAELEAERQAAPTETRSRGLDPDVVDTRLYQTLLHEAEGRTEDGLGRAPRDEDTFYGIEVEALLAAPDAAAYRVQRSVGTRGRVLGMAAVALVGLIAVVFSFLGGRPQAGISSTTKAQAKANDTFFSAWAVDSVDLEAEDDSVTLPVHMLTERGSWPAEGVGIEPGARMPQTICLPAAHLARAQATVLRGNGDAPDRRYRITNTLEGADLVLVPCRGALEARYGVLLATLPLQAAEIGTAAMFGDQSLQLDGLRTEGSDADPTLPADQMRVIATFSGGADVDWVKLNPVLLTESGQRVNAGETIVLSTTTELRYLVNTVNTRTQVMLTVTPPDTARAVRWRGTIAPPETRDNYLRRTILIDAISAVQSTDGITITMTVRSNSVEPTTLTDADLFLTSRDTTPVEVLPFRLELARNVPSPLTVRTATLAPGDSWALRLGNATYTLALPERR